MLKYSSPRWFRFFTIVIISSLCLLFDILTRVHFNKIELPKDQPEYKANMVEGKVYNNSSGKLLYKLFSDNAWEFPNDERIFMTRLKIYLYEDTSDNVEYFLTSENGWVNYHRQIGQFGLNTQLIINDKNPRKTITITGKNIDFDINQKIFSSNDDIKAIQDQKIVNAHGFSYDYGKQFLTLKSKVKINYVQ